MAPHLSGTVGRWMTAYIPGSEAKLLLGGRLHLSYREGRLLYYWMDDERALTGKRSYDTILLEGR